MTIWNTPNLTSKQTPKLNLFLYTVSSTHKYPQQPPPPVNLPMIVSPLSAHINLPAVTCNSMSTDFVQGMTVCKKDISWICPLSALIWNNPTGLHNIFIYSPGCVTTISGYTTFQGILVTIFFLLYSFEVLTEYNFNHCKWMVPSEADVLN
jgi:hypothetical protein